MIHNPTINQLRTVDAPTDTHFYNKINLFLRKSPPFSVFFNSHT